MHNHGQIVSFLWGVADLIRDSFKRGKYQDVILPLTVLRRLDCVLEPTKAQVLATEAKLKGRLENLDPQLRKAAGFAFYNTSRYTFETLLADAPNLAANLRRYIAGFSPNMREVVEKFDFDNTLSKLDEAGLLFHVVERFKNVDLHPDMVDNPTMGTIFEELIRKFNEALDENPGEHFTPRDVVHLMVDLLFAGDRNRISRPGVVLTVCDPCCGSGGMLSIAKDHVLGTGRRAGEPINPSADVHLFGQEVNPETFAICKSDLFMKSEDGRDAESVPLGESIYDFFDREVRPHVPDAWIDEANPDFSHRGGMALGSRVAGTWMGRWGGIGAHNGALQGVGARAGRCAAPDSGVWDGFGHTSTRSSERWAGREGDRFEWNGRAQTCAAGGPRRRWA